ncbi:MAG: gamma-glutamylcyclotransferase [Paracoccaceae bacterium]
MIAADAPGEPDLWVFGYGSLIWNPGFAFTECRTARLDGYRRGFALTSIRYRGTPEAPGLVLALDWAPGAICLGRAYRVPRAEARGVAAYLQRREMVNRSYFEIALPVRLLPPGKEDGDAETVEALTFAVDRTHRQYAGRLPLEDQARIIAHAAGPAGRNAVYLAETAAHLAELGIEDPDIAALDRRVKEILGTS